MFHRCSMVRVVVRPAGCGVIAPPETVAAWRTAGSVQCPALGTWLASTVLQAKEARLQGQAVNGAWVPCGPPAVCCRTRGQHMLAMRCACSSSLSGWSWRPVQHSSWQLLMLAADWMDG